MAWEVEGEIEHGDHGAFHIIYGWFWKKKEQKQEEGSKELGMYWDNFGWGINSALVIPPIVRSAILDKYQDEGALDYFKKDN